MRLARAIASAAVVGAAAFGSAAVSAETIVTPDGAVVTTPAPSTYVAPDGAVVSSDATTLGAPIVVPAPTATTRTIVVETPVPSVAPAVPSDDLDAWMDDYSRTHGGYITRDEYLREMARRWDAADINGNGLTPAEVSNLTHRVDSNAPAPLSGAGVQPGNMGPGSSRGQ